MKIILSTINNFIKEAGDKNIAVYAAGIAFFWILSAVPIIAVISSLFPYVGLSEDILAGLMAQFLPETTKQYLTTLIHDIYSRSVLVLPLALLVSVWSSGRGMLSLIRGLNGIHGITEERGYFKLRVIASFYTVVLVIGMMFCLIVLVFGQRILDFLERDTPVLSGIIGSLFKARYVLAVFALSLIFSILYTYVPVIHTSFRKQLPGGCLAALGCTVFSFCFSVYVDCFNDFSSYGSINTVVIIMLWLYFSMYILLYGAYIVSYFEKEVRDED